MADVMDVVNTLVGIVAGALYPNGTDQPAAAGCPPMIVYPGWPLPEQLQADLAANKAHVNVYPRPEERNVTCYPRSWQVESYSAPSFTLTVSGQTVTVAGAQTNPVTPQNLCVIVKNAQYVYAVQASDTASSIAAALATLIAVDVAGTSSSGAVITIPAAADIDGTQAGGSGTLVEEISRQERLFQIGIWSPTPAFRDAIAKAVDPALRGLNFIQLPDGSSGRLIYKSSPITDGLEKEQLYRRDLLYTVEYATTLTTPATEVVVVDVALTPQTLQS